MIEHRRSVQELESSEETRRCYEFLDELDLDRLDLVIVWGHPTSDVGKSSLIGRLLAFSKTSSSVIKYDGFLNTQANGQFPSSEPRQDFPVYASANPNFSFDPANQLILGDALSEFLFQKSQASEHLRLTPHLMTFIVRDVVSRWKMLGSPRTLFIEVGGRLTDPEVQHFFLPALRFLSKKCRSCRTVLLCKINDNRYHYKSAVLQNAIDISLSMNFQTDLCLVRTDQKVLENEQGAVIDYLTEKVRNVCVGRCGIPRVLLVPYFEGAKLEGFSNWVEKFCTEEMI